MKQLTSILLALTLLVAVAVPAFAAAPETVSPLYINTSQAGISMTISTDGSVSISLSCIGLSSATNIDATVYLERKVGTSWVRVDIGTDDNTWKVSSSNRFLIQSLSHEVTVKGEYKATVIYSVYGKVEDETLTFYDTRTF